MSKLSELIFYDQSVRVSSPFGKRAVISTSAGKTSSFHNGVDYATGGKKIPQYAIADGVVLSCGKDTAANGYAKYVWVSYPDMGYKLMHYHLDSIAVVKGQKVKKGTMLGKTGKTGKATGIHLHLGLKKISGGDWLDAEKWSKEFLEKYIEPKKVEYKPGTYQVKLDVQRVRQGAGTEFPYKEFKQLSSYAQMKIKALNGNQGANGYVKGMKFDAKEIKYNSIDKHYWGHSPSGWIAVDLCSKVD